jgi:hypothetical protein
MENDKEISFLYDIDDLRYSVDDCFYLVSCDDVSGRELKREIKNLKCEFRFLGKNIVKELKSERKKRIGNAERTDGDEEKNTRQKVKVGLIIYTLIIWSLYIGVGGFLYSPIAYFGFWFISACIITVVSVGAIVYYILRL